MKNKYLAFSLGLIIALLCGCSSSRDTQLQMRHSFYPSDLRTSEPKFDFTLTWFVPPAVLFGNEKRSIWANMGLKSQPSLNPSLVIDNETRLKLEDIAIKRLENELIKNQMCLIGYKITNTKWFERSIQLLGKCLPSD